MRAAPWMLAAVFSLGSFATAQMQVQLTDGGKQASMPAQSPSVAPGPLSADMQDVTRLTLAATANLMNFQQIEGLPFAATGRIAIEQTLADGSTISNSYDVANWRDAEGKTRVEYVLKMPGLDSSQRMVMVHDPKNGTTMNWMAGNPQVPVMVHHMLVLGTSAKTGVMGSLLTSAPPPPPGVQSGPQTGTAPAQATLPRNVTLPSAGTRGAMNVSREDLPADNIAGLYVTGVRTTTVIQAGSAGNEHDITVTSETWTSPELKITVRQITDDPRSGKVTTELTAVTRTDPDPALFQVPEGYTVRDLSLPAPAKQ